MWLGVLVVAILGYILVNTLRTEGPGSSGPPTNKAMPPFAMPLVLSDLDGDANVARKADQGRAGKVPACSVRGPRVLNSCDLADQHIVVLGFLFTRGASCNGSFDALQRIADKYPQVSVAGVIVRGDRDEARKLVREKHWTFPIGFDHDGAVANVYGIAGCPEVVLAHAGGRVAETLAGRDRAERDLGKHVAALVQAAKDSS
jgi:hypothetical protein